MKFFQSTSSAIVTKAALFGFMVFILVNLAGFTILGVHISPSGVIGNCPVSGGVVACKMTVFEHISGWQNMFLNLPSSGDTTLLLASFLFFVLVFKYAQSLFLQIKIVSKKFPEGFLVVDRNNLLHAFSQGILNPKLF